MADEFIDVTIKTPSAGSDLQLSGSTSIRELLGEMVATLQSELGAAGKEDDLDWLGDKDARWSLVTPLKVTLPPQSTLKEQGVEGGATLILAKNSVREPYARLIDDTPSAIAAFQKANIPTWERPHSRIMSIALIALFALIAPGLGVYATVTNDPGWVQRSPIIAAYAIAAIGFLILSAVLSRRSLSVRGKVDGALSSALGACGYTALLGLGQVLFPGGEAAWGGIISAALLVAAAMVMLRVCGDVTSVHYGAAFVGSIILTTAVIFGAATAGFGFPSNTTVVGVQLVLVAVAFLMSADRLALSLSNIPPPFVPTTGEDYVKDRSVELSSIPLDAGSRAVEATVNHEAGVVHAHRSVLGFFVGGVLLIIGALTTVTATLETHPLVAYVFSITVVIAMLYRGRSYDDASFQGVWLGGAALALMGVGVGTAISGQTIYLAVTIAIAFVALLATVIFSLTFAAVRSPIFSHRLELLEKALYFSMAIDLILIMEIWQTMRAS